MTTNETLAHQQGERAELSLSSREQLEHRAQLNTERERGAEHVNENREKSADNARREIETITAEREPGKRESEPVQHAERKIDSTATRKKAYTAIMKQTQAEMSTPERAFSRVIHNPVIEKVSDIAGNTIARPDAILSGAVFAFILTLAIYILAKQSGYPLTGTETIAAFIIGWAIGNIYDFAKVMMRGRR